MILCFYRPVPPDERIQCVRLCTTRSKDQGDCMGLQLRDRTYLCQMCRYVSTVAMVRNLIGRAPQIRLGRRRKVETRHQSIGPAWSRVVPAIFKLTVSEITQPHVPAACIRLLSHVRLTKTKSIDYDFRAGCITAENPGMPNLFTCPLV